MKRAAVIFMALCSLVLALPGCTKDMITDSSTTADQTDSTAATDPTGNTEATDQTEPLEKPRFLFEDQAWGYYLDQDSKSICRMNIHDPSNAAVLLDYGSLLDSEGHTVTYICAVDELLFFTAGFDFYRYDMARETLTKLSDDARVIGRIEEDFYFTGRECTIYKINAYEDQAAAILESDTSGSDKSDWKLYKNFIVVDQVLYYYMRNPDGLYRYENGESSLIDGNGAINEFSLAENNGKLYYTASTDGVTEAFEYDPISDAVNSLGIAENGAPAA